MIQRYSVCLANMVEADGEWVKYEDYQAALAQKDEEIARLNESYDADMHAWVTKNEQLQADLDHVMGEAIKFAGQLASDIPISMSTDEPNPSVLETEAVNFLATPEVQSWRARRGKERNGA